MIVEDTAMKYEAWGWNVLSINGNDPDEIRAAIKEAQAEKERPTLIIGKTVMGKGARKADGSSYEANCATHGAPLGGDAYVNTTVCQTCRRTEENRSRKICSKSRMGKSKS